MISGRAAPDCSAMRIRLTYGRYQMFRYRHRDLNVIGRVEGAAWPLRHARWRLNQAEPVPFYVEQVPDPGIDWTREYKGSPAVNRLKDLGDFNVEIPVTHPALVPGSNGLTLEFADQRGESSDLVSLEWNPRPVPLPLDLSDLSFYRGVQELGQVVNGAFDLDAELNVIRSRAPVYPDSLLLLGSPHGSQEATYRVRFLDLRGVKWLGPSDFFAGHEEADPPREIKPGWSSAGMAALKPNGEARSFLAWGDHSGTAREWVVQTRPPRRFEVAANTDYRVRHRVEFRDGVSRVRWRIWPEGGPEPQEWLCEESDESVATGLPRHRAASFGLFQHSGMPIEWSDIRLHEI
jgi:hypothetical protein